MTDLTDLTDIRALLQQARVALPSTTTPAASARSIQRGEVCPPPVLERDSRERAAPPAVTPAPLPPRGNGAQLASSARDPASEPPVRPPGAPAWLRIGGRGARERYARGDGVCLWTGQERRHRVSGQVATLEDCARIDSAWRNSDRGGAPHGIAVGGVVVARVLMAAGVSPRVIPPKVRRLAAWSSGSRTSRAAALRWLRRVCGRPIGLRALVAAWRKAHPEHWGKRPQAC